MSKTETRIIFSSTLGALSYIVTFLVSIWMTPFLISRLGDENYGIIPLVNSIIFFLTLCSMGIYQSLGRHVTLHFAKSEFDLANEYFSTGFWLLFFIGLFAIIPLLGIVCSLPYFVDLMPQLYEKAQFFALFMGLNCILTIVGTSLGVPLYSSNLLFVRYGLDILDTLMRTGFIVFAFLFIESDVLYVAIATLVATFFVQTAQFFLAKWLVPPLKISWRFFRKKLAKPVLAYGSFVVIGQLGIFLTSRTDLILVDLFFGAGKITFYSLAARWGLLLGALMWMVLAVVSPTITALDASHEIEKIQKATLSGMRYGLFLCLPPCLFLILFGKNLLNIWVGGIDETYVQAAPIFGVLMVGVIFTTGGGFLDMVLRGLGFVKLLAYVSVAMGVANICFSILLVKLLDLGIIGIAIGSVISNACIYFIFLPIISTRKIGISLLDLYRPYFKPILAALIIVFGLYQIQSHFSVDTWFSFVLFGIVATVSSYGICFVFILTKDDRKILLRSIDYHQFWPKHID